MSYAQTTEKSPTQGQINQAAHCDLRGILRRKGVKPAEAHELRVTLLRGSVQAQNRALKRIKALLIASPSPMKGCRPRRSTQGGRRRGDSDSFYGWDRAEYGDYDDSYRSRNRNSWPMPMS